MVIGRAGGGDAETGSVIRGGAGDGVFLVWTPGTWGEQMLPGGHFIPVFTTGLSVDVRDGQYRAVWPGGARARSPPGNEGWSGQEGQPPGSSGTKERVTPAERSVFPRLGGANRHGSCQWDMSMAPVGLQARKLFHHWGAIPQEYTDGITEACRSWLSRCWDRGTRLCRTLRSGWAGAHRRWSPQCSELGNMGGGCGLPDGIVGLRGN